MYSPVQIKLVSTREVITLPDVFAVNTTWNEITFITFRTGENSFAMQYINDYGEPKIAKKDKKTIVDYIEKGSYIIK